MSRLRARIIGVVIVASLGGLAAVALVQRSGGPSQGRSASNAPTEVRTQVIRRTRRVVRRPGRSQSSQADGGRARPLTASAPPAPSTPLTTRGSGSGRAGYEDERDDGDDRYEESGDERFDRDRYQDGSSEYERSDDGRRRDGRREEDD